MSIPGDSSGYTASKIIYFSAVLFLKIWILKYYLDELGLQRANEDN
jgi:hypothetical protein